MKINWFYIQYPLIVLSAWVCYFFEAICMVLEAGFGLFSEIFKVLGDQLETVSDWLSDQLDNSETHKE